MCIQQMLRIRKGELKLLAQVTHSRCEQRQESNPETLLEIIRVEYSSLYFHLTLEFNPRYCLSQDSYPFNLGLKKTIQKKGN